MSKNYIHNLETGKIELHFEKSEYLALTAEQKQELKRFFLFAKSIPAWVSRGTKDHYWAIKTAKKLGFEGKEITGERLSYEEQLNRKAEKAENRAERYLEYASNAEQRGKNMQKELESHRGDIAFFTQPIISGHSGSQSFGNRRQKIFDRYFKGFEEYKKSEYFRDKAATAEETASKKQLDDPVYLDNRIRECVSTIKKIEKNIILYEDILHKKENNLPIESSFYDNKTAEQVQEWIDESLDKIEWHMDKQAFLENCMDEIRVKREETGKKLYSQNDIKPGYLVKIRGRWEKVIKVNKTTVQTQSSVSVLQLKYPYAEIQDMKIPEDWTEQKEELKNPFQIGDILTKNRPADNSPYMAYQVIKTTNKTVTVRQIKIVDHKPVKDDFIENKTAERRTVKQDRQGNYVVNDNDWYLYKYNIA